MKVKRIIGAVALALMLVSTSVAVMSKHSSTAVAGDNTQGTTQKVEDDLTEANQKRLIKAVPPPELSKSLERENLKKRLEFQNDANRIGYVYLLADTGQVINWYTIKGKPSSMNSMLTTTEQIKCRYNDSCVTVASPDLDGSYGDNPEGIFFFTADGVYAEWSGRYIYSSERLNIQTPVSLSRNVQQ